MSDLKNSVIIPRDDFVELESAAYNNQHVPTASERVGSTLQTTAIFGVMAGAITAATWGCMKAADWLEERRLKRKKTELEIEQEFRK